MSEIKETRPLELALYVGDEMVAETSGSDWPTVVNEISNYIATMVEAGEQYTVERVIREPFDLAGWMEDK